MLESSLTLTTVSIIQILRMQILRVCLRLQKKLLKILRQPYDNKLSPESMDGRTISISNIGSIGGGWFTPVINQPDVAILGVGRIDKEPYVNEDGEIVVGRMMKLSLTYDHRLIDGGLAQTCIELHEQVIT